MSQTEFKVGDRVRCIYAGSSWIFGSDNGNELVENQVYTVEKVLGSDLKLVGVKSSWLKCRFVLEQVEMSTLELLDEALLDAYNKGRASAFAEIEILIHERTTSC